MTELPGLPNGRPSTPDGRGFWNVTLLVTAIVLTVGGWVDWSAIERETSPRA